MARGGRGQQLQLRSLHCAVCLRCALFWGVSLDGFLTLAHCCPAHSPVSAGLLAMSPSSSSSSSSQLAAPSFLLQLLLHLLLLLHFQLSCCSASFANFARLRLCAGHNCMRLCCLLSCAIYIMAKASAAVLTPAIATAPAPASASAAAPTTANLHTCQPVDHCAQWAIAIVKLLYMRILTVSID